MPLIGSYVLVAIFALFVAFGVLGEPILWNTICTFLVLPTAILASLLPRYLKIGLIKNGA